MKRPWTGLANSIKCETHVVMLLVLAFLLSWPFIHVFSLELGDRWKGFDLEKHGVKGSGRRGAVASLSAQCSQVGIRLMEMGGNAADAVSYFAMFIESEILILHRSRSSERNSALE